MENITYRIQEIGEVVGGGTPSTKIAEYWGEEIPWISPADLSGYNKVYIERGEKNISKLGLIKSSTVLLPPNTVLLTSRAPIGYLALAKNSLCTNQGFKNIICNPKIVDYKYLYYYLKQNIDYIKLFSSGATFPEISGNRLKRIKITIEENVVVQNKIASILSSYDELIETNNKRIKLLEQMAENLYKEWFVRFRFPGYENAEFENGIPKGWDIKRVKNCVSRLSFGKLYKSEDTMPTGKVIVIDQSNNSYVGFHNEAPAYNASLDSPIALFGDHTCKMVLMIRPFSLSENVVPYVGQQGISTIFLHYAVREIIETSEYKRHWTEFTSKKILVPNLQTQENFAKKISYNLSMILNLSIQNQYLVKQRDLLLPRLMSGKLEV